jgi:hypothetical protein
MTIIEFVITVFVFTLSVSLRNVSARTMADSIKALEQGDAKILMGALIGDEMSIRIGIEEGGSVNASVNPFLGKYYGIVGR